MSTIEFPTSHTTAPTNSRLCCLLIGGLLLLYLACCLVFAFTAPLFSDDYLNTGTLCQLVYGIPYQDFQPWNNLLGHYIQLPAFLLAPDPVYGPVAVRIELGILSFLLLSFFSWQMLRDFSPQVVLLGLIGLLAIDFFLWMSVAIRLDTLSAWAGFGALLLGLRGRWVWCGLFCGLSYLLSQKGAYQFICLNGALATGLLLLPDRRSGAGRLLRFNLAAGSVAVAYYLLISALWGSAPVLQQHTDKLQTLSTLYRLHGLLELSLIYVFQTNYLFTALSFTGFALLLVQGCRLFRQGGETRASAALRYQLTLCVYFFCLLIVCAFHPHPYAYFLIILFPTLWLFLMHTLSAGLDSFDRRPLPQRSAIVCILTALLFLPGWLLIPNNYWTPTFFYWMCFLCPLAMILLCTSVYLLCRRCEQTQPQIIRALMICAVGALLLLCASVPRIVDRLFQPAWYNADMAENFLIPKLNRLHNTQ